MVSVFFTVCSLGLLCSLLIMRARQVGVEAGAIVHDITRSRLKKAHALLEAAIVVILVELFLLSFAPAIALIFSGSTRSLIVAITASFFLLIPTALMAFGVTFYTLAPKTKADISDAISYIREEGFIELVEQRGLVSIPDAISALGGGPIGTLGGTLRQIHGALIK